uniref:Uncharacterized protein n=1 Tax=Opuntia streptacantha TaxID=393608 RepID=A0A7C9F2Z2_OPUST
MPLSAIFDGNYLVNSCILQISFYNQIFSCATVSVLIFTSRLSVLLLFQPDDFDSISQGLTTVTKLTYYGWGGEKYGLAWHLLFLSVLIGIIGNAFTWTLFCTQWNLYNVLL